MLRHAHLARPVAGFGGHAHMLGADADGRRPVLRRDLPADQVHLRRADEACDEEVARACGKAPAGSRPARYCPRAAPRSCRPWSSLRPGRGSRRSSSWPAACAARRFPDASPRAAPRRGSTAARRRGTPRLAHDGPPDGDALALTARQLPGPPVEVIGEVQRLPPPPRPGGSARPASSLAMRIGKAMFLRTAHVRVERVGLEHHGKAAPCGRHRSRPPRRCGSRRRSRPPAPRSGAEAWTCRSPRGRRRPRTRRLRWSGRAAG
jgi:hypothetical protein